MAAVALDVDMFCGCSPGGMRDLSGVLKKKVIDSSLFFLAQISAGTSGSIPDAIQSSKDSDVFKCGSSGCKNLGMGMVKNG